MSAWNLRRGRTHPKLRFYRPLLTILEDRTLPGFLAPLSFDAGTGADAVAVGDFNGDGIPDLAVADHGDIRGNGGGLSVLLGNGDGSFQPPRTFAAGLEPYSVAVGDFNGDGIPDLAVVNYGSGNISVLLGNGDGSFQPARTFAVGPNLYSVAVGDFTGDGILDLAVTSLDNFPRTSGSVSVLLGNGDGTFQRARTVATGHDFSSVVVGDVNEDGILDLASVGIIGTGTYVGDVFLGNGDGSFRGGGIFDPGSLPYSVTAGDFNGDGILDLAVANHDTNTVSVVLGNGDGSFRPARSFAAGPGPSSVAVGDFNGDGTLDLTVADYNNPYERLSGGVSVLLGNGDGSFQPARSFTSGYGPESVAVGDFNDDGTLDLAVANTDGNTVSVLLGSGDGSFQVAPTFAAGLEPDSVTTGDFNGDGIPDLAVANYGSNTVSVLLGNGDGSFQPAHDFAAGPQPSAVVTGDFNGDGILDLAVADFDNPAVSVLLGNGDGTFQPPHTFEAGFNPSTVAVGDFNGDGILDLATPGSVLLGNGDGTFQPPHTFEAGLNPSAVAVGDFNGDGIPDLAVATGSGVSVLLGNGDGTFQPAHDFAVGSRPDSVIAEDFNGDGILDLAVANEGTFPNYTDSSVSVLLGNGDGSFQDARNFSAGGNLQAVTEGDFTGDGIPDLAAVGSSGIRVLLGNGDGSFQTTNFGYATGYVTSVTVGDLNDDGLPDLAVTEVGEGVTILDNDGNWSPGPGELAHRHLPARRAKPQPQSPSSPAPSFPPRNQRPSPPSPALSFPPRTSPSQHTPKSG